MERAAERRRVLVVAHGHPDFGPGGGEIAAYTLFRALRSHPGVETAAFLARTAEPRLPIGAVGRLREGEYLVRGEIADWPLMRGAPCDAPPGRGLADLLAELSPNVVFLHHYVHMGLETLAEIRAALPAARLVLTLHDYVAICRNQGLMVTTGPAGTLCARSGAAACHRCFPDQPEDLFDRRRARMLSAFAALDAFVAPSAFLKARYVDWGLEGARIAVIDNGVEGSTMPAPRFEAPIRLGFFGQARPRKGLEVALAALHVLEPASRARFRFGVNASRLEAQEPWYRALVRRLAEPLEAAGIVTWHGAYAPGDLDARMASVDTVLVPSTWWENAPLVIAEAFARGRPVIGSRLGGIAERVRDGTDGLLFAPGDARDLAQALRRLLADPSLGPTLAAGTRPPTAPQAMAEAYLALATRG